jgi:2'-hydroxyisoflavone reductase
MRLLVLGGTVFLGRHVVETALSRRAEVTLFTRGRTQPDLFPGVRRCQGDRDGGLGALLAERWDAVIDTSGFVPRVVAQSAKLDAERYVFVSSISAMADLARAPTEDSETLPPVSHENVELAYGALKAASERVLQEALGPRAIVVRPGLLGGPHDPTGRFTYWPLRLAEGGDVVAPAPASAPAAVLDVRDLATFLLDLATSGPSGPFHALGLPRPFGALLDEIRRAVGGEATLRWVDAETLGDVAPWSELPLWLPGGDHAGMMAALPERAVKAGLRHRPLAETARDTLAWARALTGPPPRQEDGRYAVKTLTREKERAILECWLAAKG